MKIEMKAIFRSGRSLFLNKSLHVAQKLLLSAEYMYTLH